MSQFLLHFFKERSRELNKEEVVYFFEEAGFEIDLSEKKAEFRYIHPNLGYSCTFYMTPKSVFPNIQRISPQYLEVNFYVELPILSPTYFVKIVSRIVKMVCERFNLYVLSEMFSGVLEYNEERILKVFNMVKKAYLDKYPDLERDYHFIREDKLTSILRYIDEKHNLKEHYNYLPMNIPPYLFLKDDSSNYYIAVAWKEGELTVFPPNLDYILFTDKNNIIKVIDYNEFLTKNKKLLQDVPGFLLGTKVVNDRKVKQLWRSAKKGKWTPVAKNFAKYHLHQLMDL